MDLNKCKHEEQKIVMLKRTDIHKAKIICVKCNAFLRWHSLKTPEQRQKDRQKHIADYYKKLDNSNLFENL